MAERIRMVFGAIDPPNEDVLTGLELITQRIPGGLQ
jgi:hypothetical protein